jgi:nucleoside-diphosphate-sugar epimerase
MEILVIGGTRNLGHYLVHALVETGHRVTVFNRGLTLDELPDSVVRLRGDRTDAYALKAALNTGPFDAVIDMVLYNGEEAEMIVDLLSGRTSHYIFMSSGQVYLVREAIERPFSEEDYAGRVMPAPKLNTYGYEEWSYGVQKRRAEDVLTDAGTQRGFPYTTLRLPMVNSPRDPFNRLYGYMLRIKDGGPILVPHTPQHPLRHVYAGDVVQAVLRVLATGHSKGRAYNISQDETVTLAEMLAQLCALMDRPMPELAEVRRSVLEANGFLPDCSPFSDRWMSELDNARSKSELGLDYTPLSDYLPVIIRQYLDNPPARPASYRRRAAERKLLEQIRAGEGPV